MASPKLSLELQQEAPPVCAECEDTDNVRLCGAYGCTAELCERCMKEHRYGHAFGEI